MKTCSYPPVLPVLAGIFTESFGLEPLLVDKHAKGLVDAGMMDPEYISADSAGALLLACLNTDPYNVTGAYHLPLSGVIRMNYGCEDVLKYDDPSLDHAQFCFGSCIGNLIHQIRLQAVTESYVREIFVSGKNQTLKAGVVTEHEDQRETRWYGHQPIQSIQEVSQKGLVRVQERQSVSGRTLAILADFLNGSGPSMPGLSVETMYPDAIVH